MEHLRKEHNFIFLTVGLALLGLVAAPLEELAGGVGVLVIQPVTVLTLAPGLGSIYTDRRWLRWGLALLAASVAPSGRPGQRAYFDSAGVGHRKLRKTIPSRMNGHHRRGDKKP